MTGRRAGVGSILRDALSLLVGQLAAIGFGVADTMLVGRYSSADLAALSLGISVGVSVMVTMFGVMSAIMPVVGRNFGAKAYGDIGHDVQQGVYLALLCSAVAMPILWFSEWLLVLARVPEPLHDKVALYLRFIACSVPFSLLFRVFSGLNVGISRPTMVTLIQLAALPLKVVLSAWFIYGGLGLSAMGSPGAGLATMLSMLAMAIVALALLRLDRSYARYAIFDQWRAPSFERLGALLRLGVPSGAVLFVEVTSFTVMAIFISRLGTNLLAGHQIASSVATVLYMLPLSLAMASSALCAQQLGAGDAPAAQRTVYLAARLTFVVTVVLGVTVFVARDAIAALYSPDAQVAALAASLFIFIAMYQLGDGLQCLASFLLRSYKVAVWPLVVYVLSLWGVGLGGGYALGFNVLGNTPVWAQGANGFWLANALSLALAAIALLLILRHFAKAALPIKPAG
jgi:multidrug resistance protein, MATE family